MKTAPASSGLVALFLFALAFGMPPALTAPLREGALLSGSERAILVEPARHAVFEADMPGGETGPAPAQGLARREIGSQGGFSSAAPVALQALTLRERARAPPGGAE